MTASDKKPGHARRDALPRELRRGINFYKPVRVQQPFEIRSIAFFCSDFNHAIRPAGTVKGSVRSG